MREGEARTVGSDSVQVMSIHAAKGLEFPVVVVGDLAHSPRSRSDVLIDPELGVLLPKSEAEEHHPAIYQWAARRDKEQDDAESDRLFYVAATRACDHLLLSGNASVSKRGALSRIGRWLELLAGGQCLQVSRNDARPEGRERSHGGWRAVHPPQKH